MYIILPFSALELFVSSWLEKNVCQDSDMPRIGGNFFLSSTFERPLKGSGSVFTFLLSCKKHKKWVSQHSLQTASPIFPLFLSTRFFSRNRHSFFDQKSRKDQTQQTTHPLQQSQNTGASEAYTYTPPRPLRHVKGFRCCRKLQKLAPELTRMFFLVVVALHDAALHGLWRNGNLQA
jgi:hypothetical protein